MCCQFHEHVTAMTSAVAIPALISTITFLAAVTPLICLTFIEGYSLCLSPLDLATASWSKKNLFIRYYSVNYKNSVGDARTKQDKEPLFAFATLIILYLDESLSPSRTL